MEANPLLEWETVPDGISTAAAVVYTKDIRSIKVCACQDQRSPIYQQVRISYRVPMPCGFGITRGIVLGGGGMLAPQSVARTFSSTPVGVHTNKPKDW